jgi:dihydropteroate synthase
MNIDFGLPFARTLIMGIINTTPDSFSDGGVHFDTDVAIESGLAMLDAGTDVLDIGGESTRPGSSYVDTEEEIKRTIPVIRAIAQSRPGTAISIDTRRSIVAEAALRAGASIINDVSGFRHDPVMIELARDTSSPIIVMHMLGEPKTMQTEIYYKNFPGDILDFFVERIELLEDKGIAPEKIIIDPGIGFGKTFDQNLIIINRLKEFTKLGKPVLIGPSRKAFLGKVLDLPIAADRDIGTLGAVAASILNGASIIRVHEVINAIQVCKVLDAIIRERAA